MIKAVIFDYGGVIVKNTNDQIMDDISEAFKTDKIKVVNAVKIFLTQYQTGKITTPQFWHKLSAKLNKPVPKNYQKLWIKSYTPQNRINDQIVNKIKNLRSAGYKIACLSNTIKLHTLIEQNNYHLFDVKVLSCNIGLVKPDPKIYKAVVKKLKLKPSECIYIDDTKEFLKPAKKLGMGTIYFQNEKQCIDILSYLVKTK
ncbi:MAG: HAD family phosphatase [Nanoarchaeota archaeon]